MAGDAENVDGGTALPPSGTEPIVTDRPATEPLATEPLAVGAPAVQPPATVWDHRIGALRALGERVVRGEAAALRGLNAYDAALATGFRRAAVLALFTPPTSGSDPDLFLVQRAQHLRHHPGEIALPGGSLEPGEDAVAAALREAGEEIGTRADEVEVLGRLDPVMVPITRFVVTPVLGWTTGAVPESGTDHGEIVHTLRVCVADLVDPGTRCTVRIRDHRTAGFLLPGGLVWGMTGNLLAHLLAELGWALPWDEGREVGLTRSPGGVWQPVEGGGR